MEKFEKFTTDDLGFVTYLTLKEYKTSELPTQSGGYTHYTYHNTPELEQEKIEYYLNGAKVEAFAFYKTLQGYRLQAKRMKREGVK